MRYRAGPARDKENYESAGLSEVMPAYSGRLDCFFVERTTEMRSVGVKKKGHERHQSILNSSETQVLFRRAPKILEVQVCESPREILLSGA